MTDRTPTHRADTPPTEPPAPVTPMGSEPVVTTATITATATAILALLVAAGLDISDELRMAILGVIAVLAPLVVIVARRWTVPTARVVEHVQGGEVVAGEASPLPTGTPIQP